MALSALFYFDFAWFREQFCLVLCPYGRLQSVLHDGESIVIGYDTHRGEPRAPLRRTALPVVDAARAAPASVGACIDCKKCAWTCPTGIDIRNGFQMECVSCAQCIDVCDEVMDKIGRPRGLIRYDSLNRFEGKPSREWRPRLAIYGALAFVAAAAFVLAVATRVPFEANVLRPVGVPWVIEGDQVRNQIEVHLVNKRAERRSYHLSLEGPVGLQAQFGQTDVTLASLAHARIPVVLVGNPQVTLTTPLTLVIREAETGAERKTPVRFLAPR
jgi:cytochrome c oxidase accessory protein FixG